MEEFLEMTGNDRGIRVTVRKAGAKDTEKDTVKDTEKGGHWEVLSKDKFVYY